MSDEYLDAVAESNSADEAAFESLPLALAQRVFLALPADARGRACCVCRGWRDVLADPSLWTRLDMSIVGIEDEKRCLAMMRGAAGRARARLCELDISQHYVELDDLLPVLTANAGSLRELHLRGLHGDNYDDPSTRVVPTLEELLAAAPLLQLVAADELYWGCFGNAVDMLRAEPPYAVLQMRGTYFVALEGGDDLAGMDRVAPFAAALADATLQPALLHVCVEFADTTQPAVMGALVDAALARRLPGLSLEFSPPPAAAPLARLLTEGSLAALGFGYCYYGEPLFDAAGAALMADALRVNTTLTELKVHHMHLGADVHAAQTLLGALAGHPSLRELWITEEQGTLEAPFAAALAALIAADAPALQVLVCYGIRLRDAGLAPIVEALTLNRHLRELDVSRNGMSEAFARERLLPAVEANTTLRTLRCRNHDSGPPAAAEAEEPVRRRGQRG